MVKTTKATKLQQITLLGLVNSIRLKKKNLLVGLGLFLGCIANGFVEQNEYYNSPMA